MGDYNPLISCLFLEFGNVEQHSVHFSDRVQYPINRCGIFSSAGTGKADRPWFPKELFGKVAACEARRPHRRACVSHGNGGNEVAGAFAKSLLPELGATAASYLAVEVSQAKQGIIQNSSCRLK
jgi:hypothetical protein